MIQKFITPIILLTFGMLVVMISLFSANNVYSQGGEELELSRRRLYLSRQIMPDHILYPMVVMADRLKLEVSSPAEKPWVRLIYAQRRADYAEELLKKGYRSLAYSTLNKGCKYHLEALAELLESSDLSLEAKKELILQEDLNFSKRVERLKSNFIDEEQQEINKLLREQKALIREFSN